MKTKIVYTLVGNVGDVYLGQAIISAFSVRKSNHDAQITIVTDEATGGIINSATLIRSYFDEVVVVNVPDNLNKMQSSRFIKTTLRKHISGDYLYIDTDTVVIADLSECDTFSADVAAVVDRHANVEQHPTLNGVVKDLSTVGLAVEDLQGKYFNSGVMYVKDSELAHEFYEKWYHYWDEARKREYNIDQPPLAKANKDCGYMIHELPGEWNCQMVDNFVNIMDNAKILHYFASHRRSPYTLYDETLLKKVAESGIIDEDIKAKLDHPKSLFREHHLLVHDEDVAFNHSYVHDMYAYHRWVFNIFEGIARFMVTKSFKK